MKKIFPTYILGVSTLLLGVMVSVGIYSAFFIFPKYFASPPVSFALWREDNALSANSFWIPIQIGTLVTLTLALIFNWKFPIRRKRLLIVVSSYIVVWIISLIFFVPLVMEFLKMPANTVITEELSKKIHNWQSLSWFRHIILLAAYIIQLTALATPAIPMEKQTENHEKD
jgi:hypothetical protein